MNTKTQINNLFEFGWIVTQFILLGILVFSMMLVLRMTIKIEWGI